MIFAPLRQVAELQRFTKKHMVYRQLLQGFAQTFQIDAQLSLSYQLLNDMLRSFQYAPNNPPRLLTSAPRPVHTRTSQQVQ